jgi:hypothetical protein
MTKSEPPLAATKALSELVIHLEWAKRIPDGVRIVIAKVRDPNMNEELIWIADNPSSLDVMCERLVRVLTEVHLAVQAAGIGQPARPKSATPINGRQAWA